MNTLLLTIIFLVNLLTVSNDSNSDYEYLMDKSKKFNMISYDKIVHDSQAKLLKTLKSISKNQNRMVVSIDHILQLIDHEIITINQSELIWTYLSSKLERPEEIPKEKIKKIEEIEIKVPQKKEETDINFNKTNMHLEEKKTFSFYQMMILILIAYVICVFFIIIIFVALYQREIFILLCFVSVFLSYNFLNYARILKDQMNADFIPSIFFNSSFWMTNLIIHLVFIKLRLQKKLLKWTDVFLIDESFKGKIMHAVLNILLSYNLAFSCKSGLIQFPFFFSIYYAVYLISGKMQEYFHHRLWPSWLFTLSMLAIFFLHYIYRNSSKSFIFIQSRNPENIPDFQFVGYFFSVIILNSLFPVYLYIQHKSLWKIYKSPEFSYKLVFKNFREEISQDFLIFDFSMICYHIYAIALVFMIYMGLKIKMFLMVVVPSFALQSYMGFIVKDERFFWMFFFYIGSLYVLNAVYLIGKMEDKLSLSV